MEGGQSIRPEAAVLLWFNRVATPFSARESTQTFISAELENSTPDPSLLEQQRVPRDPGKE